jgi:3-oxoacyl-[acyl-carrier protein] reductase
MTAKKAKVALIAGGARGFGRAAALDLAARGWSVAFCWRTSADEAASLEARLREIAPRVLALQCDVSDPAACAELVRRAQAEMGRIDALLNCAGPYRRVPLSEETPEGWRSMFDHNLHPVFYLCRLVAPLMRAQGGGRIVNFAMVNAESLRAQPDLTAYYTAKAGVLVLTRTLARVLGPHGITVNAISPGYVDSHGASAEELERVLPRIPAGRFGTAADVLGAIRYLLSDEAAYVNGANLQISGGWGL